MESFKRTQGYGRLSVSVRIAYYYSADRAGRPVSAQENASRRSGKVTQRGYARRYGQAYIGCLITDNRNEKMSIYRGVDEERSICTRSILFKNFPFFDYRSGSPIKHLHTAYISFAQLAKGVYIYIYKLHTKHPIYEACRRAGLLASASRSFILSPSPTRFSPPSISFVRGMNHWSLASRLDAHTFVDDLAKLPIQPKLMIRWWNWNLYSGYSRKLNGSCCRFQQDFQIRLIANRRKRLMQSARFITIRNPQCI